MILRSLALLAVLAVVPVAARAVTMDQFALIGEGNDFTFTLPASPMPSAVDAGCPSAVMGEFCLDDVTVQLVSGTDTGTMEFFDADQGGGLAFDTLSLFGGQLYSGPESSPTFLTGSFPLVSGATPFPDYTAVISAITPEPASWMLLASGVCGGLAFWRRRA